VAVSGHLFDARIWNLVALGHGKVPETRAQLRHLVDAKVGDLGAVRDAQLPQLRAIARDVFDSSICPENKRVQLIGQISIKNWKKKLTGNHDAASQVKEIERGTRLDDGVQTFVRESEAVGQIKVLNVQLSRWHFCTHTRHTRATCQKSKFVEKMKKNHKSKTDRQDLDEGVSDT